MAQCCSRYEKIKIANYLPSLAHGPTKLSESFANLLIKTKKVHAREKTLERLLTAFWVS